jgi:hypothetical protein
VGNRKGATRPPATTTHPLRLVLWYTFVTFYGLIVGHASSSPATRNILVLFSGKCRSGHTFATVAVHRGLRVCEGECL